MGIVFDQSLNTTDNVQFVSLSLGDDTKLVRDSANTFAMRNGTSPNNLNVYNTYTSNTDYERLEVKWDSGVPTIAVAVDGNGNYPNWLQIQNESSKFLVKHNGFEFQDATTLLQLNPTNIKVFKDFYPNNDGETSFGTSNNRWLHTYSVNGSFSGDLVVEDGGNQYIYNTYTDASNYERLELKWNISNVAEINTAASGTGIVRTLRMRQSGGSYWADWEAAGIKFYGAASLNFNVGSAATAFYKNINPDTNVSVSCGVSASRWSNTYSIDGSFSGDLNIEDGGYFKLFGLGDSHTNTVNTQWLEISSTTQSFSIATLATGTGVSRDIYMSVGGTSNIMLRSDHTRLMQYVRPQTTNTTDIGTSSFRFRKSYLVDGSFSGDFVIEDGGSQYFYNTYTDASNYERLEIKWDSNEATIATTADGTGAQRQLVLNGSSVLTKIAGINKFNVSSAINYSYQTLQPGSDSVHTLGASPRRWSTTYTDSIAIGQNTLDAILTADAADTLALRNSTTAQAFNVYNTYTDASNYERLEIFGNGSEYRILSAADGTGAYRNIRLGGYQPSDTSFRGIRLDTSNGIFEWIYNNITKLRCDSTTFNVSSTTTTTQDVRPKLDSSYDLGSDAIRWSNTYTDTLIATDTVSAGDGSRTAPAFTFGSQSTMGIYRTALNQMNLVVNSSARGVNIQTDAFAVSADMSIGWRSANNLGQGTSFDTQLHRESTGVIGQYNQSTDAPQAYHLYNTWTDASNYERLEVKWDANVAKIGPSQAGTGSARNLQIGNSAHYWELIPGSTQWNCKISGLQKFRISSSSVICTNNIIPLSSLIPDVGTTSNRWGAMYVGGVSTGVETFTTSSDTLDTRNNVALCDCTSNAITINLPAASTATGLQFYITKVDNSANTVTIDPDSSETIDGSATKVLTVQYQSVKVVSDGSNWYSVASQPSASDVEGSGTAGSLAVWTDTDTIGTGLLSESSNILTQKNSTNAQAYHLYNTDDGAGNYERLEFKWDSDEAKILTVASGAGTVRDIVIAAPQTRITDGNGTVNGVYITPGSAGYNNEILSRFGYLKLKSYSSIDLDYSGSIKLSANADGVSIRDDLTIDSGGSQYIYNTYTDASNYERLEIKWDSNVATISATSAGTGSDRSLKLRLSELSDNEVRDRIIFTSNLDQIVVRVGGNNATIYNQTAVSQIFDFLPSPTQVPKLGKSGYEWAEIWSVDGNFSGTINQTSATADVPGHIMTTSAGDHKIHVTNNVMNLTSYNRLKIYNGVTEVFDSKSSPGIDIANGVPHFNRGLTLYPLSTNYIGFVVKGLANQVANLSEYRDSTGSVLRSVDPDGNHYIYNTYTDASNYERLEIKWDTNVATIDSTAAGTGTARSFDISYNGSKRFRGDSAFSYMYQANGTYLAFGSNDFKPQQDSTIELGTTFARWLNTYTDTITIGDGVDAVLTADAADTLALRNGTTHQTMHIYGTYTDASNYERLVIGEFNSFDDFVITSQGAGTGINRVLYLSYGGVGAGNRNIGIGSGDTRFYKDIRPQYDSSETNGVSAGRWANTYTDKITIGDGTDAILNGDGTGKIYMGNDSSQFTQFAVRGEDDGAGNYNQLEMRMASNGACGLYSTGYGTQTPSGISIFHNGTKTFEFTSTQLYIHKPFRPTTAGSQSLGTTSVPFGNLYISSSSKIYFNNSQLLGSEGGSGIILEQRNGTTEQRYYLYNTYTDGNNYERLEIKWDSNTAMIEATSDGTGSNRTVAMGNGSGGSVAEFSVTGVKTAHIRPKTHQIYTLGNGIARWKTTFTSGLATDVETFTATDTLDDKNQVCLCNATSGNITLNLPVASSTPSGTQYQIKKIDSSSNTVIITPNSGAGDLIDGSATYTLSNQWEGAIIVCDGADWFITGGVTISGGGGGGGLGGGD